MQLLATWQHAGLMVSASPLILITLAPAGRHGARQFTVKAETAAAARQLTAKITAALKKPCVCAAYSETAELEQELAARRP